GPLNAVTGVAGLTAMLWLYAVVWHQAAAESIAWVRSAIPESLSSAPALVGSAVLAGSETINSHLGLRAAAPGGHEPDAAGPLARSAVGARDRPLDSDVDVLYTERKRRIAFLATEGPRMLEAGNWQQASELCGAWASLALDN